ncbi:hypothetical protein HT031_006141 [Scenedesmus sp. PABB004]|nr:hypothetical protein HT031_006141 [Scenedesmus sp. PABB004]
MRAHKHKHALALWLAALCALTAVPSGVHAGASRAGRSLSCLRELGPAREGAPRGRACAQATPAVATVRSAQASPPPNELLLAAAAADAADADGGAGVASVVISGGAPEFNPLLDRSPFPLWGQIRAFHIEPAVVQLIAEERTSLAVLEDKLLTAGAGVGFDDVFGPLTQIRLRLDSVYNQIDNLLYVMETQDVSDAVDAITPQRVKFDQVLKQSRPIYDALTALATGPAWGGLTPQQQRLVTLTLAEMRAAGAGLSDADKAALSDIESRIEMTQNAWNDNLLESLDSFELVVTNRRDLDGLPASAIMAALANARKKGRRATWRTGPWVLRFDGATADYVEQFASNRTLRRIVYEASTSLASSGQLDNTPLMLKLLELRLRKAQLLGYKSFAEMRSARMSASLADVNSLLGQLLPVAKAKAAQENADVAAWAAAVDPRDGVDLGPSDWKYWRTRYQRAQLNVSEDEVRQYLTVSTFRSYLADLAWRLYGVNVVRAGGSTFCPSEGPGLQTWHPSVEAYCLFRPSDPSTVVGLIYLDLFARPQKSTGGWSQPILEPARYYRAPSPAASRPPSSSGKKSTGGPSASSDELATWLAAAPAQVPSVVIVSDQDPPPRNASYGGLMWRDDVAGLLHEFGHAMQHLLSTTDLGLMAGLRGTEEDSAEVVALMHEKWAGDPSTLTALGRHWRSAAPLPLATVQQVVDLQSWGQGVYMAEQLALTLADLRIHSDFVPGVTNPHAVYADVYAQAMPDGTVLLPSARRLNYFDHIFFFGYEAAYYSYIWSDVSAADLFATFSGAGLANDSAMADLGGRFEDSVLAPAGSAPMGQLFAGFMGRPPRLDALLAYYGLDGRR